MSWTDNGPVSIPPQTVVVGAAVVVALAAIGGVGFGFRAGWRDAGRPAIGIADQTQSQDSAIPARPIVDITAVEQQAPANSVASNATEAASEQAATNDVAIKTAAAEAAQSKPAEGEVNPDQIYTPPSEKPQAPAKPTTDEQAPRTDVPF